MNKAIMMGRLTKDPEVRYTTGESPRAVAKWSLAVDRQYKGRDGKSEADFFACVAFGKTAEFVEKYFRKGMKILVEGRLQNDHYKDRDGKMQYNEQIIVDQVEFTERKAEQPAQAEQAADFTPILEDDDDEGIPFTF